MTAVEKDYLELIRCGAGLCAAPQLSVNPDWESIYRLANEHAVIGVLADCLEKVKVNDKVEQQLFEDSLEIVRRNKQVNELLVKIVSLLQANGIEYVLQKGQGVAQCYPNPMLRMSGDIDLLLNKYDYDKAKVLLEPYSTQVCKELHEGTHIEYCFGELSVELHASEFSTLSNRARGVYNRLMKEVFDKKEYAHVTIEGTNILQAPKTFDAFYLFLHTVKHYFTSGIGMRQLLDLKLFMKKNCSLIDFNQIDIWVNEAGLAKEWNAFYRLDLCDDTLLLRTILRMGNMGKKLEDTNGKWYLIRVFRVFSRDLFSAMRYWPFSRKKAFSHWCVNTLKSIEYALRKR